MNANAGNRGALICFCCTKICCCCINLNTHGINGNLFSAIFFF